MRHDALKSPVELQCTPCIALAGGSCLLTHATVMPADGRVCTESFSFVLVSATTWQHTLFQQCHLHHHSADPATPRSHRVELALLSMAGCARCFRLGACYPAIPSGYVLSCNTGCSKSQHVGTGDVNDLFLSKHTYNTGIYILEWWMSPYGLCGFHILVFAGLVSACIGKEVRR